MDLTLSASALLSYTVISSQRNQLSHSRRWHTIPSSPGAALRYLLSSSLNSSQEALTISLYQLWHTLLCPLDAQTAIE